MSQEETHRSTEKFQTLHPDPTKQGVSIELWRYEAMRAAIFSALEAGGADGVRFMKKKAAPEADLFEEVEKRLTTDWGEASVAWYCTSVKLDLEARNEIERVPKVNPQRLRLKV